MASECTKPKKPRNEQESPGSKGSWRDSPTKPTLSGTTPNAGAKRMEVPPMPGSGSNEERKDEEKSVATEPDPETT